MYWDNYTTILNEWTDEGLAPEVVTLGISDNTITLDVRLDFWRRAEDARAGLDPDVVAHRYADEDTELGEIVHGPDYARVRHLTLDIDHISMRIGASS